MDEIFTPGEVATLSNISQANESYATSSALDPELQTSVVRHLAIAQRLVIRGSIRRRAANKPPKAAKEKVEKPKKEKKQKPAADAPATDAAASEATS